MSLKLAAFISDPYGSLFGKDELAPSASADGFN